MKVSMGDRLVGDGEPCLLVAEIGENNNGDLDIACAMIAEAAAAGADAVKFQTITAEEIFNPSSPGYSRRKKVEMDHSHYPKLVEKAQASGVTFFSTPFDEPSADFLDELGVPFFKIGSGELTHFSLLRHIARKGKPMIVSTGMANYQMIDNAATVIKEAGNDQLIIAHCVSAYPAAVESANVRAVPALRDRLGVLVGFSDHTISSSASLAAIALGACYIEKHFTLSRSLPDGDNDISIEPHEFKALVRGVRETEAALGKGERSLLKEEEPLVKAARRSIYARVAISKGQQIAPSDIAVRRPQSEIGADEIDSVVGRLAGRSIDAEEPLRWDSLEPAS